MRFLNVAILLISIGLGFSSPIRAAETNLPFPSFPCSYAALAVEKTICSDPMLRTLDWSLDDSYRRARIALLPDAVIIAEQSEWLTRRNACGTVSCVKELYRTRVSELRDYYAPILGNTDHDYHSPSYDCRRARPGVEETICRSHSLSSMDWEISDVYQRARIADYADRKALRKEQNQWVKDRNACDSSVCIAESYRRRIAELRQRYLTRANIAQSAKPETSYNVTAPRPQLSRQETVLVEKLIFNGAKCMAKKWVTDKFQTPEEKAIIGAAVTFFFDGELPPAGKVAGSYAIDKFRQWLKENGHSDLASALGDLKTADCIMRGVFY